MNDFINQSQLAGAAAVACSELLGRSEYTQFMEFISDDENESDERKRDTDAERNQSLHAARAVRMDFKYAEPNNLQH